MKLLWVSAFISLFLFNSCEQCNFLELRPNVGAYFVFIDQNTNTNLVFGESKRLNSSDIQLILLTEEGRETTEFYTDKVQNSADSIFFTHFISNRFTPDLAVFEYIDTAFINYSGIYPQDTLLIDYWYSDDKCEGQDNYPDNFSLRLNGRLLCESCFLETLFIPK